jgi:hypothetical protein
LRFVFLPIRAIFCALLLLEAAGAWAQSNSATMEPFTAKAATAEALRLSPGAPATRIVLAPVDPARVASAKEANTRTLAKRLKIGFGRGVPLAKASATALRWIPVPGGAAARWEIVSPGARALRVALAGSPGSAGLQVRFAGTDGAVYGPFGPADLAKAHGLWSPVLEGDTATVELFVPDGTARAQVAITSVAHLFVSPSDPHAESAAKAVSGSCEVDFICKAASDAALAAAGKAVARMTFADNGDFFLCTGTLLNPKGGQLLPYFYSAHHCVNTQDSADTLVTQWFYEAATCGSSAINPSNTQVPGGAIVLYGNADTDVQLLRLNNSPPPGAVYSAWDAATLIASAPLTAIHHPEGDVKKVSLGTMGGFTTQGGPGGSVIQVNWNSLATGVTEPGSSGSGIFSPVGSPPSEYRLRGGLFGGPSSCTATLADRHDYYSRFDQAFQYLAPYIDKTDATCSYALTTVATAISGNAGNGTISVATQPGCAWQANGTQDWISSATAGSGSGTVSFSVDENDTGHTRSASVLVGGQSITFTQSAQVPVGTNVVANAGFEAGTTSWTQSSGATAPIITVEPGIAHSGSSDAWLGGYTGGTDTLYQDVAIPATAATATLQFWYRIDTSETSTTPHDRMTATLSAPGSVTPFATPFSFTNADDTGGAWVHTAPADVSAYRGQTVRLAFSATNDSTNATSFRVDDITLAVANTNYTALWWNAAESGWGLNVNQQGDIVFATLFNYDHDGTPMWLFMSNGARQGTADTFSGNLYRAVGPPFNADPFPAIGPGNLTQVGTMTIAFATAGTGTLTYSVNGSTVVKQVTKQVFGSRAATCQETLGDRSPLVNYTDLWWAGPQESGWGVNVTHQDDTLFATLFTYDASGKAMWPFMSGGHKQADGSYSGDLYIGTHASPFDAQPFVPINDSNFSKRGTMRFQFTSGIAGILTYTIDGVTVSKSIGRQVFSSPLPACTS